MVAALVDLAESGQLAPLVVVAGPTASGKTALALALAERFSGEIVSCDSVAVYRRMEIGTAKPTLAERARVPHHLIDIASPDAPCTAGDYSRLARQAIREIAARGRLPIVCGGTGLYLRALVDGLFPAPPRREPLREKLRQRSQLRGPAHLHRILARLDPAAAKLIHANDAPKIVRAIEVTLSARQSASDDAPAAGYIPMTDQWQKGRDPLTGFRILSLCLNPPRAELYARINRRAARMFDPPQQGGGLVEETAHSSPVTARIAVRSPRSATPRPPPSCAASSPATRPSQPPSRGIATTPNASSPGSARTPRSTGSPASALPRRPSSKPPPSSPTTSKSDSPRSGLHEVGYNVAQRCCDACQCCCASAN